jgi:fumarate hydratase class II
LIAKSAEFKNIVKIGRTPYGCNAHYLRTRNSGYAAQLKYGIKALQNTLPHLSEIALGGTAVGTGLNTPQDMP